MSRRASEGLSKYYVLQFVLQNSKSAQGLVGLKNLGNTVSTAATCSPCSSICPSVRLAVWPALTTAGAT